MSFQVVADIPQMSVYPGEVDDTDNGASIDMNAYGLTFLAYQIIGGVSGSGPTLDGKIQESANGSSWSDIVGATFTQVGASNNRQAITVTRSMRYVRHSRAVGGVSPTFVLTAFVIPLTIVPSPGDGATEMPIAIISGTTDAELIAAPAADKKIRIREIVVGSSAAETVKFTSYLDSGPTTTPLTGDIPLAANSPLTLPFNIYGHFDCGAGEAFRIDKSGVGTLGGYVNYSILPSDHV